MMMMSESHGIDSFSPGKFQLLHFTVSRFPKAAVVRLGCGDGHIVIVIVS